MSCISPILESETGRFSHHRHPLLQNQELGDCVDMSTRTSCLLGKPKVVISAHGVDAKIFVDDAAARNFIGATLVVPDKPVLTINMP